MLMQVKSCASVVNYKGHRVRVSAPMCLRTRTMWIFLLSTLLACCQTVDGVGHYTKTTAELIRQRGFVAENHYVISADGYVLNLVRAINPVIRRNARIVQKPPVLFIHGTATNANCFLINSRGARPEDYSSLDVNRMSEKQLNHLLARDPSRYSVPFTLMNFGHEVWLLNRRGTFQSMGHVGKDMQPFRRSINDVANVFKGHLERPLNLLQQLAKGFKFLASLFMPSFGLNYDVRRLNKLVNTRYWNFSLDDQARYDFPAAVDYVLKRTSTNRSKLVLVGHSLGSAIPLMSLSMTSRLDNKIQQSLLYSPAFYSRGADYRGIGHVVAPFLNAYVGPFPSSIIVDLARTMTDLACANRFLQATACSAVVQFLFGPDGGQDIISSDAADVALDTFASHDIAQLTQMFAKERVHSYDHMSEHINRAVYGRPEPPPYDVARITSDTISLWDGNTDTLVPMKSVAKLASDFKVPVERYFINEPGIYWNHIAYFFHIEIPRLLTVPSLKLVSRPPKSRRNINHWATK